MTCRLPHFTIKHDDMIEMIRQAVSKKKVDLKAEPNQILGLSDGPGLRGEVKGIHS